MSERKELPTVEDLRKLSPRAIVAYAARCARRVHPLYRSQSQERLQVVDRAIGAAEEFAATRDTDDAACAAYDASQAYAADADAASAAYAAAFAAACAAVGTAAEPAHAAAVQAIGAARAADPYPFAAEADIIRASWMDYRQLPARRNKPYPAAGKLPALGDPIDFEQLGPLWLEGEPDWYRHAVAGRIDPVADEVGPQRLIIAYDPTIVSPEQYARLVRALGNLARAEGGTGLKRLKSRGFGVPVEEEVLL